jgi:hypothetical protein
MRNALCATAFATRHVELQHQDDEVLSEVASGQIRSRIDLHKGIASSRGTSSPASSSLTDFK